MQLAFAGSTVLQRVGTIHPRLLGLNLGTSERGPRAWQYMSRGFCPECGSPVLVKEPDRPVIVLIQAASLDDPSWHEPNMDIYRENVGA